MKRADLPALRQKALALVSEMREAVGHLDLVRPQVAVSLYRRRVRCGKSACHCAQGSGHPVWALNFRDALGQHTRSVPPSEVQPLERLGKAYRRYRKLRAVLARRGKALLALVDRMQRPLMRPYPSRARSR